MKLTEILICIWLLGLQVAETISCPEITCGNTPSNVCAKFSSSGIALQPCLGSAWCDLDTLFSAYFSSETVFPCSEEPETDAKPGYIDALMDEVCLQTPTKDDKRRIATGRHPLVCSKDADCVLQDGSKSACVCGLSGKGEAYCELAPGDEETKGLYTAACGKRTDEFLREFLYTRHFVHLQGMLSCRSLVFADIAVHEFLSAGGSISDYITAQDDDFGVFLSSLGLVSLVLDL